MKPKEQVFDDIARVAGGAVGLFSGITRQVCDEIRVRVDELAARMDLVPREDFERLEAMLSEARKEQAAMKARLEVLEKGGKKSGAKKPAAQKNKMGKK